MATLRALAIGAGAGGGSEVSSSGGGGAGGMIDDSSLPVEAVDYDVSIGSGGAIGQDGENTYAAPTSKTQYSETTSITGLFDAEYTEDVSVSSFNDVDPVWLKLDVSGTDKGDFDGATVKIDGTTLVTNELFNGTYYIDVTSLVSGKNKVTVYLFGRDIQPSITLTFVDYYLIRAIGGGTGGVQGGSGDDGGFGKFGGSGGGAAGASGGGRTGRQGPGLSGQGHDGGSGDASNSSSDLDSACGGGGGAGGSGGSGTDPGGDGGPGQSSDITGTATTYAGGGAGNGDAGPGTNGSGQENAGGGGKYNEAGKDGLFVVRYPTADFGTCTGGTKTTDGTDTIHTFTADGTLSIVLAPELDNAPAVTEAQASILDAEGEITSVSNENCDTRGFVLSTSSQSDPGNTAPDDSAYTLKEEETGDFSTGTFSLLVSGLSGNTTYYLRAYAKNSGGYTYSSEVQTTTSDFSNAVDLQTNAASDVFEEAATANGEINDIGGSNPTERGFVWGDESVTLPGNVAPEVTGYSHDSQSDGSFAAGTFTGSLTGLKRGTKYYVRAWAKNDVGYRYGNEVSFTTLDNNNDSITSSILTNEDTSSVSLTNET